MSSSLCRGMGKWVILYGVSKIFYSSQSFFICNQIVQCSYTFNFRSDEQRSEKYKLKKEKELEKEVAAQAAEDDGGFSMKVKL